MITRLLVLVLLSKLDLLTGKSTLTEWPPLPPLLLQFLPPPPSPKPLNSSPSSSPKSGPTAHGTTTGCMDNNIFYKNGELMGYVGNRCNNSTTIYSKQSYLCGSNGSLVLMQYTERMNFACPQYTPYCHHCGSGKAFCFAEATAAEVVAAHPGCVAAGSNSSTNSASSKPIAPPTMLFPTTKTPTIATARPATRKPMKINPTGRPTTSTTSTSVPTPSNSATPTPSPTPLQTQCIVGSTMFQVGDVVGKMGHHCTGTNKYSGAEFFCGDNGIVQITEQNFTCSTSSTGDCYQCSEGEAFCLSSAVASSIPQGECILDGNYSNGIDAYSQWMKRIQGLTEEKPLQNYTGYCGVLSADGSSGICDPKATKCVNDSNCSDSNSQYSMCLSSCSPNTLDNVHLANETFYSDDDSADDDQSGVDDSNSAVASNSTVSGCFFGGGEGNTSSVLWKPGYAVGYIGFACLSNTTFFGEASYCSADGSIFSAQHTKLSCPEQAPYCFQCGEVTTPGSAICSSRRYIYPDNCIPGEYIRTDVSIHEAGNHHANKFNSAAVLLGKNVIPYSMTMLLTSYFGVIGVFSRH